MINYVICLTAGFIFGFFVNFLFSRKKESSEIFFLLNEFKKSIDEYKLKNEINAKEVQNAVKDASRLAKILTTNQNLKGRFGEDCLEAILKECYPNENINYIKQFKAQNEDFQDIKPDYLIKLPNDKSVLIDCKLNLEKYIEYKENQDESLSEAKKQDFINDLNATVNLLSNKKYETAQNIKQPDFILMYIPLEPILTLIYTDSAFFSVIKNANKKNIIIVGNSSVLTTLRLIKLLWAQNTQDKNIENIIKTAQNIYDSIAKHSQILFEIKKQMEENMQNFNKEFEKLTQNSKLFKSAQELRAFGISAASKKSGKKFNEIEIHQDFLN